MRLPPHQPIEPPVLAEIIAIGLRNPGIRRTRRRRSGVKIAPHERSWSLTHVPFAQLILHGTAEWWDGRRWCSIESGDLIVARAGEHCSLRFQGEEPERLRCTWDTDHRLVGLATAGLPSTNRHLDPKRLQACLLPPRSTITEHLLDQLAKAEDDEALGFAAALWAEVLAECRQTTRSIQLHDKERWRQALAYMDRIHASNYVSRERVATAIGVHPNHLSRLLRQHCGASFSHLLNGIRIDHAKHLLATGDHPLAEIATACGFTSATVFTRTFRKLTGVPPSRWTANALSPVEHQDDGCE